MRTRLLVPIIACSLAGTFAIAQDPGDPPGRAARLSYLNGTVSFQPGGVEDWVPATLNRPLTTGDRLWTEPGARAELHIGSAALRLNGKTNFAFLDLHDQAAQVQLSLGTLSVRLRHLDDQESFEIDTPQAAFSLLRTGEYRVEVNEQGDASIITVWGGEGEATSGGQAFTIHPREQVRISGAEAERQTYDRRSAPPADSFDLWCQERDRREDRSESARHVSRDIPGYADLDEYGVWREYPEYGAVWVPRSVVVGWAPYHYGHWAWIAPWGWTWVDDAPWGYAPFHYGRWAFIAGGWGWVPGPIAVRPVYAPAMVAWVGGGGFSVGVSFGGGVAAGPAVGWFPLGVGEVWVPSYRASPRYFNQVNVSNTVVNNVQVTNVYNNTYVNNNVNSTRINYVNQHVDGAVTAVPQSAMISGRPVAQAAGRVFPNTAASAQVQQAAPVAPERAAVLGGRAPTSAAPPAAAMNRQVVARSAPPPPPVPFAQQQPALRANPGQPLDSNAMSQIQNSQLAPRQLVRPAAPSGFAGRQGRIPGGGNPNINTQAPPAQQLPPPQQPPQQPQFERRNISPPLQQQQPPPQQQPQFERRNNNPPPQQQQPQLDRRATTPPPEPAPPPQFDRRSPPPSEPNRQPQVERQGQRPVEGKQERRDERRQEKREDKREDKKQ